MVLGDRARSVDLPTGEIFGDSNSNASPSVASCAEGTNGGSCTTAFGSRASEAFRTTDTPCTTEDAEVAVDMAATCTAARVEERPP